MPLPQTEQPGRLQAELMSRGLRMTHQRRTSLSVVETAKQHLDASQILRKARKIDAGIDRVTVYRALNLLKRHGLVFFQAEDGIRDLTVTGVQTCALPI